MCIANATFVHDMQLDVNIIIKIAKIYITNRIQRLPSDNLELMAKIRYGTLKSLVSGKPDYFTIDL